ncbi:MAG: twin-arginine translocase TatA/TatE family subunit [Myxococcota bacterium]|nr:twin-arginine translocase TatA/TatE family subunit [Myxococcota bacterium]
MFGMGGTEIIVILIVALLFLGPDKLPAAAKTISKGIRDIKKQTRSLQNQIEGDEQIGGAIRDLKSALRGDEAPAKIRPIKPRKQVVEDAAAGVLTAHAVEAAEAAPGEAAVGAGDAGDVVAALAPADPDAPPPAPSLRMPPTAGESDPVEDPSDDADLAALVKPAPGTIAKGR